MPDQMSTDASTLTPGQHRHGGQCRGRNRAVTRVDPHPAEQDVPDDSLFHFGDKREEHGTFGPQAIDQAGFVRPAKAASLMERTTARS